MQKLLQSQTARRIAQIALVTVLVGLTIYFAAQKNYRPVQYVQLALDGLRGGTIYALVALGFVTVFNVTGIINFAQGAFAMLGAMIAVSVNIALADLPGVPRLLLAGLAAVLITTLVGVIMERVTIFPARDAEPLTLIIITVGVFIVLQGIALLIWGTDSYSLDSFTTFETSDHIIRLGGEAEGAIPLIIRSQSFWIWGTAAVLMAGLWFFFERTMIGRALKACSDNRQAAALMGISPERMSMLSFALAAAVGAIGGFVLAPATRPIYDMGLSLGLKGFIAAIIGCLVNPAAAVVGGLMLVVIENLGAGITRSGFKDVIAFLILILMLLFRPQGLFTRQQRVEKV
ncbi:MAG: branched-chain amino acid ABC transporter permease [Anaerolineae bacterium]